ncbi:CPBP family intramembrane glutamic endopeptidase [Parvularcula sp. IMCC14364]|uniref:CPBP family intramembrane glutamic endopeptidase n=1 Tax=Parvularcula sp. IMCC14364 TaxID=3067902 RepID=UPI0027409BE3|nr:CPBP family intramembrane glutamic endopeptidase [Parvularcula sp. IMCC14364]
MVKRSVVFLLISCTYSWGLFYALRMGGLIGETFKAGDVIYLFAYMFGPAIGALVTAMMFDRGALKKMLGLRFMPSLWWLVAILVPALAILAATWLSPFFNGVETQSYADGIRPVLESQLGEEQAATALDSMPPFLVVLLLSALTGALINGIATLSEELGWRGYLWSVFRPGGFWSAALFTGLAWGLWHAPIIVHGHNYPGEPVLGPIMMVGFCLMLSPWMGYLRDRSGSVFAGSIFHGVLNAVAPMTLFVLVTDDVFLRGIVGIPGLIVMVLMTVPLFFLPKKVHDAAH